MRNIFDQYSQPENRLTHALMTTLDKDREILRSFLNHFSIVMPCKAKNFKVSEQTVPGVILDVDEVEAERRGLPDGLIYNADLGCVLIIESKINDDLTQDQLRRHWNTIKRRGYDAIQGLAITVGLPRFKMAGWKFITWRDVYSWACGVREKSAWASELVDYFNVAEARMTQKGYLLEGTITDFAGINFENYTYLEGKRTLRLLTEKIRSNTAFVKDMNIDPHERRPAITNDLWGVWDYICFSRKNPNEDKFTGYPHLTIGLSAQEKNVEAMITFPDNMKPRFRKNLVGMDCEDFLEKLNKAHLAIEKSLGGVKGFQPVIRIIQRHFRAQRIATVDGVMTVDLRACFGGLDPNTGQVIKKQPQWAEAAYALLANKDSNLQMQLGVIFASSKCEELKNREADRLFYRSFKPLRKFIYGVLGD